MTATSSLARALAHAQEHREAQLQGLFDFLRLPSISTQPAHRDDTRAAAVWLADALKAAGMENVAVAETPGHPLVVADWLHAGPGKPTVLVYGHYDVQPPDPLAEWNSAPFEPAIEGDRIVARGVADDKGQVAAHLYAVAAYLQAAGGLPVNVRFLIEGEEEIGGPNLEPFIAAHRERLAADVAFISDTAMLEDDQPAIIYGLRGLCYVLMDVQGPGRDLHSGAYGGAIDNPLNALAHIIAGLKDRDGRVQIPGFYDQVRPVTAEERALLARVPLDPARLLANTGAPALWGEPEFSLAERLGARPTLDVNGLTGGYTETGRKTVLPARAHAKLSMRLVPDQDPAEIAERFRAYVESLAPPTVTVKMNFQTSPPSISALDTPAMRAAAAACRDVFGRNPVFMREGGSIPVVAALQQQLGMESVLLGFAQPDSRIHSPNEHLRLPAFYQGIETIIRFYAYYGS